MSALFLKLLDLSLAASGLILAVLLARLLLKRAPRWILCLLWALVAIRLICPFSLESSLSLVPNGVSDGALVAEWAEGHRSEPAPAAESIPDHAEDGQSVMEESGMAYIMTDRDGLTAPEAAGSPWVPILSGVWVSGVAVLLLYALISYARLKRRVAAAVPVQENILACDEVKSPFILGIFRPRIYVPSAMAGRTLEVVITHEKAHIRRRDHWWKPLGYLLLAVYWFNPLCWLAYGLLCRDIELACDEKVIRGMDRADKAAYSQALLDCSVPRRGLAACPVAFGEVGVRERVKSVLHYKKPAFWVIAVALAVCAVLAVCFLTRPRDTAPDLSLLNYKNAISLAVDSETVDTIYYPPTGKDEDGAICIGHASGKALAEYLDQVSWQKWDAPREGLPSPGSIEFCLQDDYRVTVYQKPRWAKVTCGDKVRYYKTHGGDYESAVRLFSVDAPESPVTQWFDSLHGDEMLWDGVREIALDEYPGVTFRWTSEKLEAVTEKGIFPLYTGMPIWSVYFCDLDGDGRRELCSGVSFGSGIIDNHFILYDYARGVSYAMVDRGNYDFTLTLENGRLIAEKRAYMQEDLLDSGEVVFRDGTYQVLWERNPAAAANGVTQTGGADAPAFTFTSTVAYAGGTHTGLLSGALNANMMMISAVLHLPIYRFDSEADLAQFRATFGSVLALDQGLAEIPSFNAATSRYDSAFFQENSLLLVYVASGGSAERYGVHDVLCDDICCVVAERLPGPAAPDDGETGWFLLVEAKGSDLQKCTAFDAVMR